MKENSDNNELTLGLVTPLEITPAAFLAAFQAGPYCLRSFCDQGEGRGKNYTVAAGEAPGSGFAELMAEFYRVNRAQHKGIFFVVNAGGHKDGAITQVTAHFVEADECSLDEQWDNLMAFALAPSIIVRTRKSLHGYWLLKPEDEMGTLALPEDEMGTLRVSAPRMTSRNVPLSSEGNARPEPPVTTGDAAIDPNLANFRTVQKQLAAYFGGDPVIANPSRVMRLPGFYHTKAEPVLVSCLVFEPARRYTQAELVAALADQQQTAASGAGVSTAQPGKTQAVNGEHKAPLRDSQRILKNCCFIWHCQDNAASLLEPQWYAMITNLVGTQGGEALIHQLSQPDPRYDPAKTDAKINQAQAAVTGPISCQTVLEWGFPCPELGSCPAKCPRDLGVAPLPPWYEKHPRGIRFMSGILADYLSRDKHIIYAGEAYYQFVDGVYKMVDDNHIKRIIRKQLRVDHVNMHQIKDVLGQLTLLICRSVEKLNPCRERINLQNGLYNVNTRELSPHDPGYLSTIQMATAFEPGAEAPRFMAFLKQCLDPDTQRLVQEIFGYLLIAETCAQKAFVFVGEGAAGKSTLLWVAQDLLLGRDNVSNIPWQCLDDKFKTAEMVDKLANIFADLPTKAIEDNGLFKSITGEDRIMAERKNRDPFAFVPTARLLFSCNAIPKNIGDRSEAFYRRLVIVPFLPAQPLNRRDPKLKDRFITEAPGIFNWSLAGLTRLRKNNYRFSESTQSAETLTRYRIDGSSVLSFVEECCVVDASAQTSASQIYHAYGEYCKESGLRAVSQKRFWTELGIELAGIEKCKDPQSRRTLYHGIMLDEAKGFD